MLSEAGVGALVAARGELLCAVVDATAWDPIALAEHARELLAERHGEVRAAASRRRAGRARCAAASTRRAARSRSRRFANGDAPEGRLLPRPRARSSSCSRCRTTRRCACTARACSAPIEDGEGEYGGELLRSLEAFLEHNGQWEGAARELYCHRHTLRYRIRRVEELTGRDLSSARDRIEFWLALRARELVR